MYLCLDSHIRYITLGSDTEKLAEIVAIGLQKSSTCNLTLEINLPKQTKIGPPSGSLVAVGGGRLEETGILSPKQCLTACDESPSEDVAKFWEDSAPADPTEMVRFLDPPQWREAREWGGIDGDLDKALGRTAKRIKETPELLRLYWHCYWRLYLAPNPAPPSDWPTFTQMLGDDGGIFYLLVGLAAIPLIRMWHTELGISEDITRDTTAQVHERIHVHQIIHGRPGVEASQLGWIRHYTRERYFRIGRLEYWLAPYKWSEEVFRNKETGEVVAFSGEGVRFSSEGRVFGDPENYTNGEGWTSTYKRTEATAEGHLLHPDGHGAHEQVKISLDDWECLLEENVMTLELHIPFGGGMTLDACRESIEQAKTFFATHFPDEPAVAITCGSWIFSPQLQECLPESSNLVVFQRELFLVPSAAHGADGLWFVFQKRGLPDFDTWSRKTSVQRAILEYLERGHVWGAGRMFFFLDDASRFGQQTYLSSWPPSTISITS